MSKRIKISILLLTVGFVITFMASFNEVLGDIGSPWGVDSKHWEKSLESLLMNLGPLLSNLLLLISIRNNRFVLRKIAYVALALFCIVNLIDVLDPPITGEAGLLVFYCTIGLVSLLAACVLLFLSVKKCGTGFMIAIIVCIVCSLAGLIFTILYTIPVIAGLLINRDATKQEELK